MGSWAEWKRKSRPGLKERRKAKLTDADEISRDELIAEKLGPSSISVDVDVVGFHGHGSELRDRSNSLEKEASEVKEGRRKVSFDSRA